jgi:multiple sugar transport system substrate-binding protein
VLNEDGTSDIDTPEAKKALDFINTVFADGYADGDQTYDAAQESFLNGKCGILFNGTWVVDQYDSTVDFDYAAMNMPTLFDSPAVWADSHTWVIPKQPESDPAKYRAALEFVSFLYEHDADWALGTGHISARTSVLNSPEYQDAPQRANYADTGLTVAKPVPHIANWPAVSKALLDTIESIWFQGASEDDALANGKSAIEAAAEGS